MEVKKACTELNNKDEIFTTGFLKLIRQKEKKEVTTGRKVNGRNVGHDKTLKSEVKTSSNSTTHIKVNQKNSKLNPTPELKAKRIIEKKISEADLVHTTRYLTDKIAVLKLHRCDNMLNRDGSSCKISLLKSNRFAEGSSSKINSKTNKATSKNDKTTTRYNCPKCPRKFAIMKHFDHHMKTVHSFKPYKCLTCSKRFAQQQSLLLHNRTHIGLKPHKCDICSKEFSQSSNLNTHKRIHAGINPYKCNFCLKSFSQKGNLNTHKHTHTGLRPYQCLICSKNFSQQSNLITHNKKWHAY